MFGRQVPLFWDMVSCSLIDRYHCFGGTGCLPCFILPKGLIHAEFGVQFLLLNPKWY